MFLVVDVTWELKHDQVHEPINANVYPPTATAFSCQFPYDAPASPNMYSAKTMALLLPNEKTTCLIANTVGKKYRGFGNACSRYTTSDPERLGKYDASSRYTDSVD